MTTAATLAAPPPRSVFTGVDVCREAGLAVPAGAHRPIFDEQVWDFTDVIGLPVQMHPAHRRFDFTAILDPRWRLVAKELVMAILAPRHEAVAPLPRAYRTPLHLNTASGRLNELTRWLNWLTARGVAGLGEVDGDCCQAYLDHRRHPRDEHGTVIGDRSPATRRAAAQVVVDLLNYRELFTTDRLDPGLRPWGGASASAIAQMPNGRDENKTPPVADTALQPMLAAALYLVTTIGPHASDLAAQLRRAGTMRSRAPQRPDRRAPVKDPFTDLLEILDRHRGDDDPLPQLPDHLVGRRLARGWDPRDPLLAVNLDALARQAGFWHFESRWLPALRQAIETTLTRVGTDKPWQRSAAEVPRADGEGTVPWTLPLQRAEADALLGIVRTAAIIVIAAISGMRSSEIMELQVGCRRPPQEHGPGLVRHRLASKVVKGQPLGGTADEWVVIEPVYQAAGLAEQLHDDRRQGAPLFGRFAFNIRYQWFRDWVNGPAGQRLGLAPIPDDPVTLRMLRRSLAIELAYRPGGLLAAKLHLRHISVATTEGYASRPGGAQAELLAEVNKHETERNLNLVLTEYRNYQNGVLPAGPGARELTAFFAHIDGELHDSSDTAGSPKVQRSDREVLNLLSRRAETLHLGTANYCWFTDPSRALCLKLAGTPTADRPLAGMCDSARCAQATHHPCHRQVWADTAASTQAFLHSLGPTRKIEKARLQADHDRARRVLEEIDTATGPASANPEQD
jgi:integrase